MHRYFINQMFGTPWEPIPGRSEDLIPARGRLAEEGSVRVAVNIGEPRPEIKKRARITRDGDVRLSFI